MIEGIVSKLDERSILLDTPSGEKHTHTFPNKRTAWDYFKKFKDEFVQINDRGEMTVIARKYP